MDVAPMERLVRGLASAFDTDIAHVEPQVFAPTGFPDKLSLAPGIAYVPPGAYVYSPTIDHAEIRIAQLRGLVRSGRLAVLNVHIEPGSGKTMFLPKKFVDDRPLVILPTPFDAFMAWHTSGRFGTLLHYSGVVVGSSGVTYTDSYYAASGFVSGKLGPSDYGVWFIDEADSSDGVTLFLSHVARTGQSYIRMTASPQTISAAPRKSFTVVTEKDVPAFADTTAAVAYVKARTEQRVLVLCPSAAAAREFSSYFPGSCSLTSDSSLHDLRAVLDMAGGTSSCFVIADSICAKGVNLDVDCVVDFGHVATPFGTRPITVAESLQRRGRTGRLRSGVYCCAVEPSVARVVDQVALFRNYLWFHFCNLPAPYRCDFHLPAAHLLSKYMRSVVEPALLEDCVQPDEPGAFSDDRFSAGHSVDTRLSLDDPKYVYCDVGIDDDETTSLGLEPESDPFVPDWHSYYVGAVNHPSKYTADMIYDHRGMDVAAVRIDRAFTVARASNRAMIGNSPGPSYVEPGSFGVVDRRSPGSAGRSWSAAKTVSRSSSTKRSDAGSLNPPSYSRGVAYGSRSIVNAYEPAIKPLKKHNTVVNGEFPIDAEQVGGPLVLLRSTKVSRLSRGTAYKTASICAGYFVVHGFIISSGRDLHKGLRPMHPTVREALAEHSAPDAVSPDYYLTYTHATPMDSIADLGKKRTALLEAGAWVIPSLSDLPPIDLNVYYSSDWEDVMTAHIRGKQPLPPYVPRDFVHSRTVTRRKGGRRVDYALEMVDSPTYEVVEQTQVYVAWNDLSVESCAVGMPDVRLWDEAARLLPYMVSADRINHRTVAEQYDPKYSQPSRRGARR